ncbi:MAG: hypothetical protein JKY54_19300 [Flavobacteriales bacterium]|nr:hypothetical protein [Flavobacteriales bacterium]
MTFILSRENKQVSLFRKLKIVSLALSLFLPSLFYGQITTNEATPVWVLVMDQNDIQIYTLNNECSSTKSAESKVVLKVVNNINAFAIVNFHLDVAFGESAVNDVDQDDTYSILVDPNSTIIGDCDAIGSKLVWVLEKPDVNSPRASVRISNFHSSHVDSLDKHASKLENLKNKKGDLENSNSSAALENLAEYQALINEIKKLESILSK